MSTFAEEVAHRLMGKAPFGKVPHVVGWDTGLSDGAFHTYYVLCSRSGKNGKTWITEKKLAKDRGKGLSTIQRHIKELRESGLIETQRKGFNRWDKHICPVEAVYKTVDRVYTESERLQPPKNEVSEVVFRHLKNEGSGPLKNEGYIEEEKERSRKPDTSYLGTLPFRQALKEENTEDDSLCTLKEKSETINFSRRVLELFPEVAEMTLQPTRRSQTLPKGMPKRECSSRIVTDSEGNPEGGTTKKSRKNPTQAKVRQLWPHWKTMIKANFGVDILGSFPVGADYGHLKNILNYVGGDFLYALKTLTYVIEEWSNVKAGCFRAQRLNTPTLYLVDAIKDELHANIQTGKKFQPILEKKEKKEWAGGTNRHSTDHSGWNKEAEKEKERKEKRYQEYEEKRRKKQEREGKAS